MHVSDAMSGDRRRILIAGDAAVATGFSRVLENIFRRLQDTYEVHHLGTNYLGDPHPYEWKVYPAGIGGGVWGEHRLPYLIERLQPKLLFIVNDIWVLAGYMKELAKLEGTAPPVVMYCPVDAGPIEPEAITPLAGVARFVTYTQFAKSELDAALASVRDREPAFDFPEIEIIPHGVDTDVFHSLDRPDTESDGDSARVQARRVLFPDREDLLDAFIVLNGNRNQPRKRIDITIRGFSLFAEDKPDHVKLYLHMGVEDQGWNVVQLAKRYGVDHRLILSTTSPSLPAYSIDHLNHVYNACEVGVNTATGEGWGLVSFEHAATGAAQIVPRHNACEELWDGAAVMVEPVMKLVNERILTEGWFVSPEGVAEALERLYEDEAFLTEMSMKAHANARKPEYSWDSIAAQWRTLFDEVIGMNKAIDASPNLDSLTPDHAPDQV